MRAVQRYQVEKGIITYGDPSTTGFGAVGPRTRQAMATCGTVSQVPYPTYPPLTTPPHIVIPPSTPPLSSPVAVDLAINHYYEFRGSGFYIRLLNAYGNTAVVEFGIPLCGNPRWPTDPANTQFTCQAVGEVRHVTLTTGSTVTVPKGNQNFGLRLESVTNSVARITVMPDSASALSCTLFASKSTIAPNEMTTVQWGSANASSARWTSGPFSGSSVGTAGSYSLNTLTSSQTLSIEFNSSSGATKTCSVDISVTSNPSISISLPVSGFLVARGQPLSIAWSSQYAPSDSKVRIEIYRSNQSTVIGNNDNGIVTAAPTTGSYQWTVPTPTSPILADSGLISGLADGQYRIVAKLYTGSECWGYCASNTRSIRAMTESGLFTIGTSTYATSTSFSATPTAGVVPLSVTFSTWFSANRPVDPQYFIEFGDGQSANVPNCTLGVQGCTTAGTIAHAYATAGTYTARLIQRATAPNSSFVDTVLNSISITVSNPSSPAGNTCGPNWPEKEC